MLALCGGLWGRAPGHSLWRRVRSEPEDGRYRSLRERWHGNQAKWFGLFQFQAALVALFSVPFASVAANPTTRPLWLSIAAAIWRSAFSERAWPTAARAVPRRSGKPRPHLPRRPVALFAPPELLLRVAALVHLCRARGGSPLAWYSLCGPVIMLVFLRWVSGIPYTEAQALRTRGDDYRDYQARTSPLFPWPPKRSR